MSGIQVKTASVILLTCLTNIKTALKKVSLIKHAMKVYSHTQLSTTLWKHLQEWAVLDLNNKTTISFRNWKSLYYPFHINSSNNNFFIIHMNVHITQCMKSYFKHCFGILNVQSRQAKCEMSSSL